MATVQDILMILDGVAPFSLAEEWDNCGLQSGDLSWPVSNILVSLDLTMDVMLHAVNTDADLIVTHHPLMLRPSKRIDFSTMPGSAIALSAVHKISIISVHTNLDKAAGGLNDCFASMLGLKKLEILSPSVIPSLPVVPERDKNRAPSEEACDKEEACSKRDRIPVIGLGRVGRLDHECSLCLLAEKVKNIFKADAVRMVGNPDLNVSTVAVCTGSGGSLISDFYRSGAQVYVTGDIKYHEARDIEQSGLGLIDLGHFASERIAVDLLCDKIRNSASSRCEELNISGFCADSDPFKTLFNITEES